MSGTEFLLLANKQFNFGNDSDTLSGVDPNAFRPNLVSSTDMVSFTGKRMNYGTQSMAPVVPQYKNYIQGASDQLFLLGTDNKIYTYGLPQGQNTVITDSLPAGMTSFASGIFVQGSTIANQNVQDMIVILGFDKTIWYCTSPRRSYQFSSWVKVRTEMSPSYADPRSMPLRLVSIAGISLGICGRFYDTNGNTFGILKADFTDIDLWSVWEYSRFASVPTYMTNSYCNGFYVSANDEYIMYGCILNNRGDNLLSVNVKTGPYDYDQSATIKVTGLQNIYSIGETNTGRMALASETFSMTGTCGGIDPIRKGARRTIIIWDYENKCWAPCPDLMDTSGLNTLSNFRVITSNIGYQYGPSCFVLATKCSENTDRLYSLMISVSMSSITKFVVRNLEFKSGYPFSLSSLVLVNGMYPIINYGIPTPTALSGDSEEQESTPTTASQIVSFIQNKNVWIGAAIGLIFLAIYIYSRIVSGVAKTQRQVAYISKLYTQQQQAPAVQYVQPVQYIPVQPVIQAPPPMPK